MFLFLGKSSKNNFILLDILYSASIEEQFSKRFKFFILPSRLPNALSFKRLSIRIGKFNSLAIIFEVWK